MRGTVKKGFGISRGWMVKKRFDPYEGFGPQEGIQKTEESREG